MRETMVQLFERIDRTAGYGFSMSLDVAREWKARYLALAAEIDAQDQATAMPGTYTGTYTVSTGSSLPLSSSPHPFAPDGIVAWTGARPEQPTCGHSGCGRFMDDPVHGAVG